MSIFFDWIIVLSIFFGVPAGFYIFYAFKKKYAQSVMNQHFPELWENIIEKNLMFYNCLPEKYKKKLQQLVLLFLDGKDIEGCGGLEMNDEIRVTIAAEAVMLLLNKNIVNPFPNLKTVLVYPHAYVAAGKHNVVAGGVTLEDLPSARLGESWQYGDVVIAWDHALNGGRNIDDGHNVVLHEFSHQLDQESGLANGTPPMSFSCSKTWATVLGNEYNALCKKTKKHFKDVIDSYGTTNPAEFFAVSTEAFFEKPVSLQSKHPKLFEALKKYYKLNPAEWNSLSRN